MHPTDDSSRQSDDSMSRARRDQTLATSLTTLIGRQSERAQISAILRDRATRLMVLTGPGGVGKTRLANAVADDLRPEFSDGVVLVNLAPIAAADHVLPALASALGIRKNADDDLLQAIKNTLDNHSMLIVLDNFEQVVDAAPLLTDILMSASNVSMLVTSRSVLNVYGERVYPVQPMRLPEQGERDPDVIGSADAVELFVARVRDIRPDFHVTPRNAADIATICSLLDGLPLALELAAARTSFYTIPILADRLVHRLPVLESGPINVPQRLRTMRNAIAWSYDLLSPNEQFLFRQLCVLVSPFNLETAAALAHGSEPMEPEEEVAMLDALESLVDKSLVQRVEAIDHDRNFVILQVLREFGLDALNAAGERAAAEERHAGHIDDFAARAEPHLVSREQLQWLNQIEVMKPDVVLAIERLAASGDHHRALRIATALWRYDYARGRVPESRDVLLRLLKECPERTLLRARALNAAGVLSNVMGQFDQMEFYHREALDIAQEQSGSRQMAIAQMGLGDIAGMRNENAAAEAAYLEAERLFTELNDPRGIATAQTNIGHLYWAQGRLEEALKIHEAARRLYESVGDQRGMGWAFANVGRIAAELRNWPHASANLQQAMELYDLVGDAAGIAETLEAYAIVNTGLRDFERAAKLLGHAHTIHQETEHPVSVPAQPALNRCHEAVHQHLGAGFRCAFRAGNQMSRDDVITLAIATPVPDDAGPSVSTSPNLKKILNKLSITERELDVLTCLGNGYPDKQIADQLYISVRTVQTHVQSVLAKLEAASRAAAVAKAFRLGILQ